MIFSSSIKKREEEPVDIFDVDNRQADKVRERRMIDHINAMLDIGQCSMVYISIVKNVVPHPLLVSWLKLCEKRAFSRLFAPIFVCIVRNICSKWLKGRPEQFVRQFPLPVYVLPALIDNLARRTCELIAFTNMFGALKASTRRKKLLIWTIMVDEGFQS